MSCSNIELILEHVRRVGRPAHTWDSLIHYLCRHQQIGNWRHCAHDTAIWMNQLDDFISGKIVKPVPTYINACKIQKI